MNSEIMIDLRNYDLADRLKVDMISVDSLLNELETALDKIDHLKEIIEDLSMSEEEKQERAYNQSVDDYIDDYRLGII